MWLLVYNLQEVKTKKSVLDREHRELMMSLDKKNEEIKNMHEMSKIREEKNREEQQRKLEEYQRKAKADLEKQEAALQDEFIILHSVNSFF